MSRNFIVVLALALTAGTALMAQVSRSPAVQFKAAEYKEQVEGDLRGAITEYQKLVGGRDQALAAQASARIAAINRRLASSSIVFGRAKTPPAQTSSPTAGPAPQTAPVVVAVPGENLREVVVVDRRGTVMRRFTEKSPIYMVSMSPDGQRIAFSPNTGRIVVMDLVTGTRTDLAGGSSPAGWSPDGSRIAHFGVHDGVTAILTSPSIVHSEEPELLVKRPTGIMQWTSDGQFVVAGLPPFWMLVPTATGDKTPIPFMQQGVSMGPRISPDGRFVAYTFGDSRSNAVAVSPLTRNANTGGAGTPRWIVSDGAAFGMSRWRSDGGEFYYISGDGYVMSVPTSTTGAEFWSGTPTRLFKTPPAFPLNNVVGRHADVSGDGQRFVFLLASPD